MSRVLSAAAYKGVFSSQTGCVFLTLVEIIHADITTKYLVNNNVAITYDGQSYAPFPFTFEPPKQTDSGIEPASLVLPNVDLSIVEIIRSINSAPTVRTALIMIQPDGTITKEDGWYTFALKNVRYNTFTVSGDLAFDINLDTNVSNWTYSNITFPGLYG